MFDLAIRSGAKKPEFYADLLAAADGLTAGEADGIANMANVAALIWQFVPDLNWAGFYRLVEGELVLGPFCGAPACIRIALGSGVCGTAAQAKASLRVDDVSTFPGHISCDAASRSELVVPIVRQGDVLAVIDLDSPLIARFDEEDVAGFEKLAGLLAGRV